MPHDYFANLPPNLEPLSASNDIVFVTMFRDKKHEELLIDLLTATLHPPAPIASLEMLDSTLPVAMTDDKRVAVDVRVRLATGDEIIVEMQTYKEARLVDRFLVYATRAFAGQLAIGDLYETIVPVRLVVFMEHNQFEGPRLRKSFLLREESTGEKLSGNLEFIAIEMGRLGVAGEGEQQVFLDKDEELLHTALTRWVRFFQAQTRDEFQTLAAESPVMSKAVEALAALSRERDIRREVDWYQMKLILAASREPTERGEARREGLAEGLAEGRAEGRTEGLAEGLEQGLERGLERGVELGRAHALREVLALTLVQRFGPATPETAACIAAASSAELPALVAAALSAGCLDDVFSRVPGRA